MLLPIHLASGPVIGLLHDHACDVGDDAVGQIVQAEHIAPSDRQAVRCASQPLRFRLH